MHRSTIVDVVVIGGGPAGLSAALVLGRARRSVALVDEELPRNRVTRESHGFVTRDGIAPSEFRSIAREQIEAYPSVQFRRDVVTDVSGEPGAFTTHTRSGATIASRKVLFATGMKDVLPAIEGLERVYGGSAFVCPYCDGWELRDQPLVVIANGDRALHMAKVLRGWTEHITLCTNGPAALTEEQTAQFTRHGITIHEQVIERIEQEGGQVKAIRFTGGTLQPCTGIFFAPVLVQATALPEKLGCQLQPSGAAVTGMNGKTTVPGVYVAGDAASERYQLIMAAADGAAAAIGINTELLEETWVRGG